MPELPDLTVYQEHLERRIVGQRLEQVRLASAFVLRSVTPPLTAVEGLRVHGVSRLAKQLVIELDGELFLVVHLMIAGRLQWRARNAAVPRRNGLAAFDFSSGTLLFTRRVCSSDTRRRSNPRGDEPKTSGLRATTKVTEEGSRGSQRWKEDNRA